MSRKSACMLLGLLLTFGITPPRSSLADNDACWGDNSRHDISCVQITEPLLLSLRGASMARTRELMHAEGRLMSGGKRPGFGDTLRFLSNYRRGAETGSGSVNVTFFGDQAVIVSANVDTGREIGSKDFIWNAYAPPRGVSDEFDLSTRSYTRQPFCSDLSGTEPCKGNAGSSEQDRFDRQLVLMKEQFGSTSTEIRDMIRISCDMGASSGELPHQCNRTSNSNSEQTGNGNSTTGSTDGRVLPFTVVRAIRNHGFKDGIVVADVSVSVAGGTPADWMATAVYVAEHTIIRDVTSAEVLVIVPNPWADFPPQLPKELAKVYFDPEKRIWDKKWGMFAADHAGTTADIEYFELGDKLLDADITDPDKRQEKADKSACALVVNKYHLPKNWTSSADKIGYLGLQATDHDRGDIHITVPAGISASLAQLHTCLTHNVNGTLLFQGCMPQRD